MTTRIRDLMTTDVVTVQADTPFRVLAQLLTRHRIAALPVVNLTGQVLGIVSEADLLPKEGLIDTEQPVFERRRHRLERAKATAQTAGRLMTAPAITIAPDATVAQAARLLRVHNIKHLPVVGDAGMLVGIVSRGDLARVYLRTDDDIHGDALGVLTRVQLDGAATRLQVCDGVVTLSGYVQRRSLVAYLVQRLRELDGVIAVTHEDLSWRLDDLSTPRLPTLF